MNKIILYLLSCSLLLLCQCKGKEETLPQNPKPQTEEEIAIEEQATYHEDTAYEYESRTGFSGNYKYNYDVSGYDSDGNEITGNVDVEGKEGTGVITNSEGNTIEVEVEWIRKGELKAVDEDGNEYELHVD